MTYLISCEFNMDTACVELKFNDGSMIAIDTIAVENEVADNMYQRSDMETARRTSKSYGLCFQPYFNCIIFCNSQPHLFSPG